MVYSSVLSAVVAALAAEVMGTATTAPWLGEGSASSVRGLTRQQADCWVHARLHSQLKPRLWSVLVARYSTHRAKKVAAIGSLVPVIATPAPAVFLHKAVTAWAIPKLRGVDGRRSTDMIVLPPAFYDMNTWDLDGRPEQTRRRWRGGINAVLEEMVVEALAAAEDVLVGEGVLPDRVA